MQMHYRKQHEFVNDGIGFFPHNLISITNIFKREPYFKRPADLCCNSMDCFGVILVDFLISFFALALGFRL